MKNVNSPGHKYHVLAHISPPEWLCVSVCVSAGISAEQTPTQTARRQRWEEEAVHQVQINQSKPFDSLDKYYLGFVFCR